MLARIGDSTTTDLSEATYVQIILFFFLDLEFPSQDQTKRNSFFGCIPPESGFTVFSAWFFDVYHPEEEFNQRGREEIKQRMNKISDDERIRLLTNDETLRFLVVRHPMTRFVSSWVRIIKYIYIFPCMSVRTNEGLRRLIFML